MVLLGQLLLVCSTCLCLVGRAHDPNQCCSAAHVPYCLHQLPFCQLASYKKRGAVTLGRTHPFQPRLSQEMRTSWVATHSLIYLHSPTPAPPMSKVLFSWVTSPGVASVTMMWRAICYKRQFEFGGRSANTGRYMSRVTMMWRAICCKLKQHVAGRTGGTGGQPTTSASKQHVGDSTFRSNAGPVLAQKVDSVLNHSMPRLKAQHQHGILSAEQNPSSAQNSRTCSLT